MSNEEVLSALKYAAPIVALGAAIWSTTQKITYEDGSGAKRLTLPGRVLIGITILSAAMSVLAIGFETVIGEQQAAKADQQALADKQAAAAADALEKADRLARDQRAAWAQIAADGKERNRFLAQRLLIIGAATDEQRRDARLSLQVARESSARLDQFAQTLAEFERINYPLRKIEIAVTIGFDFGRVPMDTLWRALAARPGTISRQRNYAKLVPFGPGDFADDRALQLAALASDVDFRLMPSTAPRPRSGADDRLVPIGADDPGTPAIAVRLALRGLMADMKTRQISASFTGSYVPANDGVIASGEKLSISDVKTMTPILLFDRRGDAYVARPHDYLESVEVRLNESDRFSFGEQWSLAGPRLAPGVTRFALSPTWRR